MSDWKCEHWHCMQHGWAEAGQQQVAAQHWMWGYPETFNPPRSTQAHELLLQSWTIYTATKRRQWHWGDQDALLLYGSPEQLHLASDQQLPVPPKIWRLNREVGN